MLRFFQQVKKASSVFLCPFRTWTHCASGRVRFLTGHHAIAVGQSHPPVVEYDYSMTNSILPLATNRRMNRMPLTSTSSNLTSDMAGSTPALWSLDKFRARTR